MLVLGEEAFDGVQRLKADDTSFDGTEGFLLLI